MKRNKTEQGRQEPWWKGAVIYQIYPRSFRDSNGDGIGDLKGILSELDYIAGLGIDAVWLNPIFSSPNDDNGYDISDYRNIMRDFGTMADFDALLAAVHERGMKLILDLVVNHTSDEHPWFLEARQSRDNPYYKFYHWWPAEKGTPPLRKSFFDEEGNAWRYNPDTDSYYLHYFSRKQPDLNWENPEVRRRIFDMMRFWFDKGIDGFRMDSITYISKDTRFPKIDQRKYPGMFGFYAEGPHLHDYLHAMNREVLAPFRAMSVGEGSSVAPDGVAPFIDPARKELDMLYHFGIPGMRNGSRPDTPDTGIPYSLLELKKAFGTWDKAAGKGWPSVYLGNHDQPRMVSRFGNDTPEFRDLSAKMLAAFLLTMRGTVYWLSGDELGMTNIKFEKIEDYNDIDTRNRYKLIASQGGDTKAFLEEQKAVGRDNARTPFQWDGSAHAGFTTGKPWLKIHPDYRKVNVVTEETDPCSPLVFFRQMVTLRKENPALRYGSYRLLDAKNPQVYSYLREKDGVRFLVALNFSPFPAEARVRAAMGHAEKIADNYEPACKGGGSPARAEKGRISLQPYQAVVYRL